MSLVARDAFGDLFLRDESGQVHHLDVAVGKLQKIAESEAQFRELAVDKRDEWFAHSEEATRTWSRSMSDILRQRAWAGRKAVHRTDSRAAAARAYHGGRDPLRRQ